MTDPAQRADDDRAAMPVHEPKCDHICLKDLGHVERGEPHFYGYEHPSPRRQSADSARLYGLPGAEVMYLDVASLYESEIDPYIDPNTDEPYEERYPEHVVEEWSVEDPINLLPQADWLLEYVEERLCEEHTHENVDCQHVFKNPEVLAAAEELRRVIASKVTWQQAKNKLADHKLTLVEGGPLFDGEPVYRPQHNDGADDAR